MYLSMDRNATAKIRLYVEHTLGQGQSVPLSREQAHYLFGVMRLRVGAHVLLFDGQSGEWRAEVVEAGKRGGLLVVEEQTKLMQMPPDLWLLFAPIKKARTDFIVEKAVEMGVARIVPVQTDFTNSGRIQRDRLQAHASEAAEQCGGTYVPEVTEMRRLDRILADWDTKRRIMFCDETQVDLQPNLLPQKGPWAVLIGPEGGFSPDERDRMQKLAHTHPVSLGPRILRADTAAVAALTFWQLQMGDWT
ncbi:16S rRNA (uracil(1498)-N(3))-methyltransferase [Roseobacter sp.]|uniref:16S rRNA (uracil(1498)-N(3))-methyltransferase n=1 Tax=Roseobacter sp. TaxID=1907202 RepID=UPI00385FC13B